MSDNAFARSRNFDHRFFAVFVVLIISAVLIGFGPTFYLKPLFNNPPIARSLIWVHGFVMTAWILLLVTQIYLVSSKRIRVHQKLGLLGIALAVILIVVGLSTAVAAAKYGSASTPPGVDPIEFMIVPFGDIFVFAFLFAAAIYYRKVPANHKRLILLTMINFLPPAIGRFPGDLTANFGPLWFYGVPSVITLGFIALDTWRNGKLNKAFLFGGLFMIAAMWGRLPLSTTQQWHAFASWLTS